MTHQIVAALLETARALVSERDLDVAELRTLLDSIPTDQLDVAARVTIQHAKLATANSGMSTGHAAVARYALARVVMLLEKSTEPSLVSPSDQR